MSKDLKKKALDYHANPRPGKTAIEITKSCETQDDLSLAYTPGVAEPVRVIADNPDAVYEYTNKGNLVGIISNGSAVLGLGSAGPLASKPVMEGKAVLFKKFADIDAFDIEVDAQSPQEFIQAVAAISPTFGGINLEDIAAPTCFEIEQTLIEQLDIPVFHDDQHGTAIIIAAGMLNALELAGKSLEESRLVCVGAGAAGVASMNLLIALGAQRDHLLMVDRTGVIHKEREGLNPYKSAFAVQTERRSLADAMIDADAFIGVSGPDILTADMLASMASNPVVFALSNPDPEINPELAHSVRSDMIMATGRSDYPNQVNNVLGFPFIFRGALDVRARRINEEMKIAAVRAIQKLTRETVPESVLKAYGVGSLTFGPGYILPKPFDPRLKDIIAPAVAKAAVESGVARLSYPDEYQS